MNYTVKITADLKDLVLNEKIQILIKSESGVLEKYLVKLYTFR